MKLISKILPVLAIALLLAPLHAQIGQGSIHGKVLDRDGKPLQGAVARIEHLTTHQADDAKTNKNGDYSLSGLFNGQYKVTVLVDGRAVMVHGDATGDAVYIGNGLDPAVNFDLRKAPATPPPTPAAAASRPAPAVSEADKAKAAADVKKDSEMRAAFTAGIAAMNAKNYEEAIKQFQAAAEKDPSQPVIFGNLGLALSNSKKYEDAVTAYRKAIELKADDPALQAQLSLVLANMGKVDEAEKAVQEVARLSPALAGESYYNLGAILTNRGKSKEAVVAFNKAIEIDPKNAKSYFQIGIAYFATPETIPQAITALEKFLQLDPMGPDAEAAKQLIAAAKAQVPTGYKSPEAEKKAADQNKAKTKGR